LHPVAGRSFSFGNLLNTKKINRLFHY
jgi:hypothetical protein